MVNKNATARNLFGKAATAASGGAAAHAVAKKKTPTKAKPIKDAKRQKQTRSAGAKQGAAAATPTATPAVARKRKPYAVRNHAVASPSTMSKKKTRSRLLAWKDKWPELPIAEAVALLQPGAVPQDKCAKNFQLLNTAPMQELEPVTPGVLQAIKDPRFFYVAAFLMSKTRDDSHPSGWEQVQPGDVLTDDRAPTTFISVYPRKNKARFDIIDDHGCWPVPEHQLYYRALPGN